MTNRGTAYIVYTNTADAEAAIAHMHEAQLDGAVVSVSIVLPRRKFSRSPPPTRKGDMVVDPNLEIAIWILIDPARIRDRGQDHTHHGHAAFLLLEAAEATGAGKRRHHQIEEGDEEVQATRAILAIAIAAEAGIGAEVGMEGIDSLGQHEQSCLNLIPPRSSSH
ncbi:MAG: hypothetical protein LQ350_007828 [Teloschistes chrysophthalmus]|nr:MAG: hypothetical protein LQ350_007828 [Niorma chrysophthalma]